MPNFSKIATLETQEIAACGQIFLTGVTNTVGDGIDRAQ